MVNMQIKINLTINSPHIIFFFKISGYCCTPNNPSSYRDERTSTSAPWFEISIAFVNISAADLICIFFFQHHFPQQVTHFHAMHRCDCGICSSVFINLKRWVKRFDKFLQILHAVSVAYCQFFEAQAESLLKYQSTFEMLAWDASVRPTVSWELSWSRMKTSAQLGIFVNYLTETKRYFW